MFGLEDYFETPFKNTKTRVYISGSIGESIKANNSFSNDDKFKLAIIGLTESRNSNLGHFDTGVDAIRSYLYDLSLIPKIKIIDLGNLKLGKKVIDTYASLQYITEVLVKENVTPIFFGGSQDLTLSMTNALNIAQKETELTIIDARIDALSEELHSNSFLSKIDNTKTLVSIMGYQTYFVTADIHKVANANTWNLNRLGVIRNGFSQIEPILRDSCIVSVDISSIRQSESPGSTFSSPNGLYSDEVCQLAKLSGLSDKLKVFSLCEYQASKDINGQSAHLCGQIIWHFMYGISQRKQDFPVKDITTYKKIYVRLEKINADLIFYENIENKRFWVEIPINTNESKIISCSQYDYQSACNNEIPDRIWQNISRYLK